MLATLEQPTMTKKAGRPKGERDDVPVRVDRAVASKLTLIATHRGVTVGEILTNMVASLVNSEYLAMIRELELGSKPTK